VTDEAIDVVVLRIAGEWTVPVAGRTPFDPHLTKEPVTRLLSELLDSTVRITLDEGIPGDAFRAFVDAPVPPAFRASPWLAESRAVLVGDDGTGRVGGLPLRYTDEEGLWIIHPDYDELSE